MATLLNTTSFRATTDPQSIAIPAATAGSTLVCVSYGGAVVTAKLGVGGTSFTKRSPTSLNALEVSCQDITATGGETVVQIDPSGARVIDGVVYEFAAGTLGAFLSGVASDSITFPASRRLLAGNLTVAQSAVVVSAFAKTDSTATASRRFWGLSPLGRIDRSAHNVASDAFWGMVGISDVVAGTHAVETSAVFSGAVNQGGGWAYANTAGTSTVTLSANPIVTENSAPGDYFSSWLGITVNASIAGYSDKTSYLPGETVSLKVDSDNAGFTAQVYRLGGYGWQGFGARLVATVTGSPAVQPAPSADSLGAYSAAAWSTTASWAIPASATPGVYMVLFRRTDNTALASQHVFVVRSAVPGSRQADRIGFRISDYTWQAYNLWGARTDAGSTAAGYTGRSLYSGAGVTGLGNRAFAVSFDRPYGTSAHQGNTWLLDAAYGVLHFLEQNGYHVDYYSSSDVDTNTAIPGRYGVFLSTGHDEYLTDSLREAYADARDSGTNLLIFGGNFCLWRVRFAAGDSARKMLICYKDSHNTLGFNGTVRFDPDDYTGTWRQTNYGPFDRVSIASPNANDGTAYTLGNVITPSVDGTVSGIRLLFPTTLPSAPVVGVLYSLTTNTTGVELARATFTSPVAGQFNHAVFTTPVAVVAGQKYVAAFWTPDRFALGANALASAGITYGHLVSPAHAASGISNGRHHVGGAGPVFPEASNGSGSVYYAEPLFEPIPNTPDPSGNGYNTHRSPESELSGQWFIGNAPQGTFVQVPDTYKALPIWRDTAVEALGTGASYTSTTARIGDEWDYVRAAEPSTPTNLVMLAHRDIVLSGQAASVDGERYTDSGTYQWGPSLYRVPSGALVACLGAWRWAWGLSRCRDGTLDVNGTVDVVVQQATVNLLCDLGVVPDTLLDIVRNDHATELVDPSPAANPADYGLVVGPGWTEWDGAAEQPLTFVGVWDGVAIEPATVDVV